MKKIFLFSFAVLTIFGCKKEIDVKPSEGTPEFQLSFVASRTLEEWSAGYDDFFMHTDWHEDDKNVITFEGKMADKNCDGDCNSSIQFELRDFLPQTFEQVDFVDKFYTGTYKIGQRESSPAVDDAYLVTLQGHNNFEEDLTLWEFGDGLYAENDSTVQHIYHAKSDDKATIFYKGGINNDNTFSSSTIHFKDGSVCTGDFKFTQIEKDKIKISIDAEIKSKVGIWLQTKKDGTQTDGLTYDNNTWTISVGEKSSIFAIATLEDNCLFERQIIIRYNKATDKFTIQNDWMDIEMKKIDLESDLNLSTFAIQYIDKDGQLYRSDLGVQQDKRFFKITSKEPYLENEAGQKTIKLGVEFTIDVFLPNGEFITLRDGKGVIAVAEP